MRIIILYLCIFFTTSSFALTINDLQVGDVTLLSLNCIECRMIESETNSLFSHSGVVVRDESGRLRIAQSLGKLDHFSIAEFTKNITPKTFVHVYRPREFKNLTKEQVIALEKSMLDVFNETYKHAPFDSAFSWNNFDNQGRELLYCSEFIAKFLDHFLFMKTQPLPITYTKHADYWLKYFKGKIPLGELGNSPGSFTRDHRFEFIGTI